MSEPKCSWTPGPWRVMEPVALDYRAPLVYGADGASLVAGAEGGGPRRAVTDAEARANAFLIAAAPTQNVALNYVADMTYCGADAEWHFKPGYDPQVVLDALAKAEGRSLEAMPRITR